MTPPTSTQTRPATRPTSRPSRPSRPSPTAPPPAPRHDRRVRAAFVVVLLVVAVFTGRLVQLQGLDASALAREALGTRLVEVPVSAERGQILDRDGVVLADSVERRDVTVDQTLVDGYVRQDTDRRVGIEGAAQDLAALTLQDPAAVQDALTGDRRFAYVARDVTPDVWRSIQALGVPGVYSERTSVRSYPAGSVAGNLLGFVVEGDTPDQRSGAGLELSLDDVLSGTDGSRSYERGAGGQMIPTGQRSDTGAVDGRDVRLTIDQDLQWYAQQAAGARAAESAAEWVSVTVTEVETGDVLAIAEAPTVDPNDPGGVTADNRGSRALSDVFEPGSTSKVVTMAAALEQGIVTPETRFQVPDRYTTSNGQSFRDSHSHPVQNLTTAGVLADSSNTGTVMIGEQMDRQTRYDYLSRFGIGRPTGLEFPGETRGILAAPDDWDGRQQYTVLFGQGLSVNALQSSQVFATIGNDGVRTTPRLIAAETDASGAWQETPAGPTEQVVSPETAAQVRLMLEGAVEEGTGGEAAIPGYRVAGKTGTAQAPSASGGYSGYTASFIGMAPAEDPKVVVAVTVQRPQNGFYGGTAAAPLFRDVMSFALQELAVPPSGEPAALYPVTYE